MTSAMGPIIRLPVFNSAELPAMTATIIVPGNERTHPRVPGQAAYRLMPNSAYREILTNSVDVDVDFAGWEAQDGLACPDIHRLFENLQTNSLGALHHRTAFLFAALAG